MKIPEAWRVWRAIRKNRPLDLSRLVGRDNPWAPRATLRDADGRHLVDLVNYRDERTPARIARAVRHHDTIMAALVAARRRARNIKGAVESGQILDKEVDVMAQQLFAGVDAALKACAADIVFESPPCVGFSMPTPGSARGDKG